MKRIITLIITLCLVIFLFACKGEVPDEKPDAKEEYNTVLSLAKAIDVVSVKQVYSKEEKDFAAFTLVYRVSGVEKTVNITVPHDYKSTSYPTVLYFPKYQTTHDTDGEVFAENGIISFTFISNVTERDLGEGDMLEVATVLELLEKCTFIDVKRIYTVGHEIGSVTSFLLAKEYGEEIAGVAVINAICDLSVFHGWGQGSDIFCEEICKGSPDDVPEEYKKRSSVYFSDMIQCPVLFITYEQYSPLLTEQCEILKNNLTANGIECTQILLNEFNMGSISEGAKTAFCDFIS